MIKRFQGKTTNAPTTNSIGDVFANKPSIFCSPLGGVKYIINITDDFDRAFIYDEVVAVLANATEQDELVWNVASYGGFVDSLQMLLGWKQQCMARQVHVLHSNADSCGSVFFLSPADEYVVGDGASMFCHEMQSGASGTTSNVERRIIHTVKQNEKFIRSAYEGFLDEQQITDCLKGLEVYLDSDEIRERLTKREDGIKQKLNDHMNELSNPIEEDIDLEEEMKDLSTEEIEVVIQEALSDVKVLRSIVKKRKNITEVETKKD